RRKLARGAPQGLAGRARRADPGRGRRAAGRLAANRADLPGGAVRRAARMAAVLLAAAPCALFAATTGDWPTYGHDKGGQRFSPLDQITPANVGSLAVAWTYHMKTGGEGTRF